MDLTPEQLQSTLTFLHTLAVYPRNLRGDFSDNALFTSLINHLKADGYGLQSFDAVDSRRLSGEVSGSSFYMDLALIFMCVLCAGLASGLTQVYSTLASPPFSLIPCCRVCYRWISWR